MDALDTVTLMVNPVVIIGVLLLILVLVASQRGWGWTPVWLLLGLVALMIVVGVITGIGIIPDGVDIFTFLFGSIGMIVATIYMIVRPKKL